MTETTDPLAPLLEKLDSLKKRQEIFSAEIEKLSDVILRLKDFQVGEQPEGVSPLIFDNSGNPIYDEVQRTSIITDYVISEPDKEEEQSGFSPPVFVKSPQSKSDLEKFVGENLINKIGIAITIIGVAIGTKYSIDHDLISPLTRIILGYILGIGLLGIGLKLKAKYTNYSAVLVSGAIAILYFITYFAYSLYNLFPQAVAFILMVVFTAYAVLTAINYNQQIIAHIGMVGAYAVPFLLGDDSGSALVLFSYMAIINSGILIISIKKYWKPIFYVSFAITWLTYFSWFSQTFQPGKDLFLALTFLVVFFSIFYIVFLAYKLLKRELFEIIDIFLLLANSFIFYGIGYSILKTNDTGEHLLGMFTLVNALIHFGVVMVIKSQKLADRNLFYLVAGLIIVFITIAVPVQLNGNWVTLLWAGEAALLCWIGLTKNVRFYEILAYILVVLAFASIVQDWTTVYDSYIPGKPETRITPLFNINFLTSLLVIASFGFINLLIRNQKNPDAFISQNDINSVLFILIPGMLLGVIYYSFRVEIATYWNQLYQDSLKVVENANGINIVRYQNSDLLNFQSIWIINYSLFFVSMLTLVNIKKLKSYDFGIATLVLSAMLILVFLVQGLTDIGQLRDSYVDQTLSEYYHRTGFNLGIRYVSYLFVALLLVLNYSYLKQDFPQQAVEGFKMGFDCFLHFTLLWIASSELNSWLGIMHQTQSLKLGLTILWGVYALILIVFGIWKKKKYLRIGAIILFGITLYKLFFVDMQDLDTIAKTIVFVSLGILLLIISFLYNKYRQFISGEEK